MRFELAYRPPYDWEALLAFLGARAIDGVEHVDRRAYRRSLAVTNRAGSHTGWIRVAHAPRRSAIVVDVSASLARAVPAVLGRVRHAFDVACDPAPIAARLGALAAARPGLRVPGACDGFELAVRAVIGQQVSVAGARTLLGRLAATFGTPLDGDGAAGVTRVFLSASELAGRTPNELRGIGLTSARARTLAGLAAAVASGGIELAPGADVERTREALEAIPGIGPWTSAYIAMRALGWPDVFLDNDLVVLRAMGETRSAAARARSEAWRPWRSYAVMHWWHA